MINRLNQFAEKHERLLKWAVRLTTWAFMIATPLVLLNLTISEVKQTPTAALEALAAGLRIEGFNELLLYSFLYAASLILLAAALTYVFYKLVLVILDIPGRKEERHGSECV